MCSKLEVNIKEGMDEIKLRACEHCSFVTANHQKMKSKKLSQLLQFLKKSESKHADFLQPVVIDNEAEPNLFHIFAGEQHPGKKACFNSIVKDWTMNLDALLKVGEFKKDECPYLKSYTFITHMKGFEIRQ